MTIVSSLLSASVCVTSHSAVSSKFDGWNSRFLKGLTNFQKAKS